jgi:hypothetical protein
MQKEYETLRKKYSLPGLKELDVDFQVSAIENAKSKFLLKDIVKKINEKLELFSNILEDILSPERFTSLHESSMFSEEEKKKALRIYRKIHYYYRQNSLLEVSYDEKETADYVNNFFSEWQEVKLELKKIIAKIKDSWKSDKKSKLELSYFG